MPGQNPPQPFLCPITLDVMRNPVITTTCGHHFDRDAITAALAKSPFCPLDRTPLTAAQLVESRAMKELIEEWLAGNEQATPVPGSARAGNAYAPRPLRSVMEDVPDIDDVISAQEAVKNKVVWSSTQGEALTHFRRALQSILLRLRWTNNRVPLPEFYASVHSAAEARQLVPLAFVRALLSALKKLPPTQELRRDQLYALLELDPFPERSRDILAIIAPEKSHDISPPISRSSSDRSSRTCAGHSPINTSPPLTSQLLQSHFGTARREDIDPARERRERAMRENKPLQNDYEARHKQRDRAEKTDRKSERTDNRSERSDQRSERSGASVRTLTTTSSFSQTANATRGGKERKEEKDSQRPLQRAQSDTDVMKKHLKQRKRIGIAVGVAAIAAVIGGGVGASS